MKRARVVPRGIVPRARTRGKTAGITAQVPLTPLNITSPIRVLVISALVCRRMPRVLRSPMALIPTERPLVTAPHGAPNRVGRPGPNMAIVMTQMPTNADLDRVHITNTPAAQKMSTPIGRARVLITRVTKRALALVAIAVRNRLLTLVIRPRTNGI